MKYVWCRDGTLYFCLKSFSHYRELWEASKNVPTYKDYFGVFSMKYFNIFIRFYGFEIVNSEFRPSYEYYLLRNTRLERSTHTLGIPEKTNKRNS